MWRSGCLSPSQAFLPSQSSTYGRGPGIEIRSVLQQQKHKSVAKLVGEAW